MKALSIGSSTFRDSGRRRLSTASKTENFTYTGNRDLERVKASIQLGTSLGFFGTTSSHLVGIGDYTAPWEKEIGLALAEGCTSLVLFALDQFCLIGFKLPLGTGARRSVYMG